MQIDGQFELAHPERLSMNPFGSRRAGLTRHMQSRDCFADLFG
jgi:hypothetical protein